MTSELLETYNNIWLNLFEGAKKLKDSYHLPVLGTVSNDKVNLRTVVLRRADKEKQLLICHTDVRSEKIKEITNNPNVSWLFYCQERKVQLRVFGKAFIHIDDELSQVQWENSRLMSRRCYLTELAPGTKVANTHKGIPEKFRNANPNMEESEGGRKNFAVISCKVEKIEWLHLKSDGHLRAVFNLSNEKISVDWLVP